MVQRNQLPLPSTSKAAATAPMRAGWLFTGSRCNVYRHASHPFIRAFGGRESCGQLAVRDKLGRAHGEMPDNELSYSSTYWATFAIPWHARFSSAIA